MPPHADYTTLTNVRRTLLQQNITSTDDTSDDDLLKRFITQASAAISRATQRVFTPYRASRLQDYYNRYNVNLDADLLSLVSITNGDGAALNVADVRTQPANDTPKWRLSLSRGSGLAFTWDGDPEQAIDVTGIWGFHTDYASAWVDTLEAVPAGGLTNSVTTFTATDADGLNAYGQPRFEVGQILRIDDEFIRVVGVDTDTEAVTIRRAQLGTTAATHDEDTTIDSWQVLPDVELQCTRLVTWAYQHRDAVQSIEFIDTGVTLRDDTVRDVFNQLEYYRPKRIQVV